MNEARFKEGELVTYKDPETLPEGHFHFDGYPQEGSHAVLRIGNYNKEFNCYEIYVHADDNGVSDQYTMLECEFEEYDRLTITEELEKIRKIIYE